MPLSGSKIADLSSLEVERFQRQPLQRAQVSDRIILEIEFSQGHFFQGTEIADPALAQRGCKPAGSWLELPLAAVARIFRLQGVLHARVGWRPFFGFSEGARLQAVLKIRIRASVKVAASYDFIESIGPSRKARPGGRAGLLAGNYDWGRYGLAAWLTIRRLVRVLSDPISPIGLTIICRRSTSTSKKWPALAHADVCALREL